MEAIQNGSATATAPKIENGRPTEAPVNVDTRNKTMGRKIYDRITSILPNKDKRVVNGDAALRTLARPDLVTIIPPENAVPSQPVETVTTNSPTPAEAPHPIPAIDEQGHMDTSGDLAFLAEANQQSVAEQLNVPRPGKVIEATPEVSTDTIIPASILDTVQDASVTTPHPKTTTASGDIMRQVMSEVKPSTGILQLPHTEGSASGTLAPNSPTTSESLTNPTDIAAIQAVAEKNQNAKRTTHEAPTSRMLAPESPIVSEYLTTPEDIAAVQAVAAKNQEAKQATPINEVLPPTQTAEVPTDTPLRSAADQQAAFMQAEQANVADWNNKVAENIAKTPIQLDEIIPPAQPATETTSPVAEPATIDTAFQVNSVKIGNIDPAKDPRFGEGSLSSADYAEAMKKQMDPAEQLKNKLNIDLTKKPVTPVQPLQPDQIKFTSQVMGEDPAAQLEASVAPTLPENAAVESPEPAVLPQAPKTSDEFKATDPEFTPQLEAAAERAKQRITELEAKMAKERSFLDRLRNKPAALSQADRQAIHDEEQQAAYTEIAKTPQLAELAQTFPRIAEAVERANESPAATQSELVVAEQNQEAADTKILVDILVGQQVTPDQADALVKGLAPDVLVSMQGKNPEIDAAIGRVTPDAQGSATEQADPIESTPIESILESAPSGLTPEQRAELNAVITRVQQEIRGIKTPVELKQKAATEPDPVKKNRLLWLFTFIKTFSKLSLLVANGGTLVPTDPSNYSSTVDMMAKASKAIADGGKIVQVDSNTPSAEPAK